MNDRKVIIIAQSEEPYDYKKILGRDVEYYPWGEVINILGKEDAGLIIFDCGFKTVECIELLKKLKLKQPSLPVIFVTDASSEDLVIKAFKIGVRDYYKKPVDADEFRKTVDAILRIRLDTLEKRKSLATVKEEGSAEHYRHCSTIPENILRSLEYITDNLASPLFLDKIAGEACISKYHFCRQFKKHVGVSPMQFAINERLKRAKSLLRRKELPISIVAIQAGFNDLSEFNKHFKKVYGLSPSAYRESHKSLT